MKTKKTLKDFAEKPLDSLDTKELVQELEARGWVATKDRPSERHITLAKRGKGAGKTRFGIVSDTHLGHRHQQITHWRDFVQKAEAWGAEFILHGGDVIDGGRMHRDQEFELFKHGASAQGHYAAQTIPVLKDPKGNPLPQYIIGGNHDGSFFNDSGTNVFDIITSSRKDLHFLGAPAATFHLGPIRILVMHPDGGVPYARSYRPQKIVEGFAPDEKPHILLLGHWHVADHLPGYRNVESFSMPCFQSQTAFMKRKGLFPVIGGLLLEVSYDERGLSEDLVTKWVIYRTAIENDYP